MPRVKFGTIKSSNLVLNWLAENSITDYILTEPKANCISIDFQTKFDRDKFVKEYYYKT